MASGLHDFLEHHVCGHFVGMRTFDTTRDVPGDYLLIWVLRGELSASLDGRAWHARPGDLVSLAPGVAQWYVPVPRRDGWEWLWVHYGGDAAGALHERLGGPVVPFGFDERVRERFGELVAAASARGVRRGTRLRDLRLDSCLFSLFGLILDRTNRMAVTASRPLGADLSELQEYVSEHLAEPITLADLAAYTGFSATHLTRLVRGQWGVPPMRYVARLRIARAADLLTVSPLSVAEVARAVGFVDPYHFSRRFKQITGHAPMHYRAANHDMPITDVIADRPARARGTTESSGTI